MNSAKTYLIALLALTTIGAGWYAWRQRAELAELRAAAMHKEERADLQKRLWDLEKLNRELQDQLAAQRGPRGEPGRFATGADGGERPGREFGGRGGRGDPRGFGPQVNAMRDLMSKPEVQALVNLQQQAGIDARYATLFKNLNLQPEQIDRLKTLLAERTTTLMDVAGAAFEQGIDPRQNPDTFQKLVGDAQNAINGSIKEVIGDAGFAQLTNYEQTMAQRNTVEQLDRRLSYTNTPLTAAQSEQLVQILATNAPPRPAGANGAATAGVAVADFRFGGPPPGRGPGPDTGFVMAVGPGPGPMGMVDGLRVSGPTSTVTDAAVAQSAAVLSPPQLQALQQIQQQQQSQQQLRQMVNDTMTANQPPGGGSASGGASAGQAQPARKRPGG